MRSLTLVADLCLRIVLKASFFPFSVGSTASKAADFQFGYSIHF